jgi:hypothetical protein
LAIFDFRFSIFDFEIKWVPLLNRKLKIKNRKSRIMLALALLVARFLADHPDHAFSTDHFALPANRFDAGSNVHVRLLDRHPGGSRPAVSVEGWGPEQSSGVRLSPE